MSDYYIKGIKDDRFKVKNQKTLELSEDEINTLKDIDVTELFDTYNFLLKNEYPESDKNLNLPEDIENLNAYDYVTNLINTDELVLLQGDLNRMSGFTSFYPEGTDTIWVDTQDPKYSTTHNIIHELGHIQTTDDGENFIPMAGTLIEVGVAQYYNKKIAPSDGEILKVLINCENDPGDTTVIFYKNGTKEAKETILDGSIGTDTAIFQTLNTYPLVGVGTADRTFSQGDILSISINPENAPGEV